MRYEIFKFFFCNKYPSTYFPVQELPVIESRNKVTPEFQNMISDGR